MTRQIHVHPLPPGHVAQRDCRCRPIVSSPADGIEGLVHRDLVRIQERDGLAQAAR